MYYDKNRRYFENKRAVMYIGFMLIIAAFVLFYIWPIDEDNVAYIPIVFLAVLTAGCVMFFGQLMRRSSEADINEDVENELRGFDEKAYFDLDLYGKELPYINPLLMQSYLYYDTPYVRRDKEGVYRTDRYVRCRLYFTEDAVCTASRTVHLTEEGVDDEYKVIKYSDIKRASIDAAQRIYTIHGRKITVKYYDLNIYGENGLLFSSQCRNDYTVECAVEDINKTAEKFRG
ncbi:MAG: hypothetical protein J6330_10720 [Clostridia bacterium]|nr:hypothetical protein [Clostridia bacterium]